MTTREIRSLEESYEFGPVLGRGGMGTVLRGRARDGGAPVAIKLHDQGFGADVRERVLREGDLATHLEHPHLVALHGIFEDREGRLALVYDLIEGRDLTAVRSDRTPAPSELCAWVREVADGLDFLHGRGLLHRDLKPSNLMLGRDGRVRLIDYGLMRPEKPGQTLTQTGTVTGTLAYLAPELLSGAARPGKAADLYALGCVVYALVEGRPPFVGSPQDMMMGHLNEPPPPVQVAAREHRRSLDAFFSRALAKDPPDRFPDATALAAGFGRAFEAAAARARGPADGTAEGPAAGGVTVPERSAGPVRARGLPARAVVHVPRAGRRVGAGVVLALAAGFLLGRTGAPGIPRAGAPSRRATSAARPAPAFPLGPDLAARVARELAESDLDAADREGWARRTGELGHVRAFLDWLDEGGRPEELPAEARGWVRAAEATYAAAGIPSPFFPFCHVAPAAETAADPSLGARAAAWGLPDAPTGWARAACAALVEEAALLDALPDRGAPAVADPTPGDLAALEDAHLRAMYALGRALEASPEHAPALALADVDGDPRRRVAYRGRLAWADPRRVLGRRPPAQAGSYLVARVVGLTDHGRATQEGIPVVATPERERPLLRARVLPREPRPGELALACRAATDLVDHYRLRRACGRLPALAALADRPVPCRDGLRAGLAEASRELPGCLGDL